MGDKTKGLYGKFVVRRTDGSDQPGEKHDGCEYFVLDLTHDKHAYMALRAYANSCDEEYPLLASDLRIRAIEMRDAGVFPTISQELRDAIAKAGTEGLAFAEYRGQVVFINDGKNEERMAERESVACPVCGGSGHKDDAINAESFVADVRRFTEAVGCTTDRFNVRQTALYIGLQLEEMAEKLEAFHITIASIPQLAKFMRLASIQFKSGAYDGIVADGDREAMLDADVDLAWVTVGSALSQGADLLGAMREVARANLDKIGPDGAVLKDENGKVKKPEGWRGPDIAPFVSREATA